MKRVFSVLVILWWITGLAIPCAADNLTLDPIVVTATRSDLPGSETAANVTVLDEERIRDLPAANVAEALTYLTGVFVDQNGGLGSQALVSIYGSEPRHVAVYVDGIPQNILANPVADLSKITLNRVARIEVYKGSASSVWGSALGGVINIITRIPETDKPINLQVGTDYGAYRTLKAEAGLQGRYGGTGYLVSVNHTESDGFDLHRDYDQDSLYLKVDREISPSVLFWLAASFDQWDKSDPTLLDPERWESARQDRRYQSLNLEAQINPQWDFRLNLRRQEVDGSLDSYSYPDIKENDFIYDEQTLGFSAQAGYRPPTSNGRGHNLTFGLDADWGNYNFSPLERNVSTRNTDFWISEIVNLGPWSIDLGARLDDNKHFGSEFSPAVGLVYRFKIVPVLLRGQWAQGYSAPPLSYLYDPRSGNPDLEPERGVTWQIGAEAEIRERLHLELNLFRADLRDMIYYDPDLQRLVNLDKARRQGAEINARLDLDKNWSFRAGGVWVDVTNTRLGEDIKDIPTRKFTLGVTHRWKAIIQNLNGRWVDYNSSQADTKDKRLILDYLIKYKISEKCSLKAAIHNLTNEKEYHWSYQPHPGRWVEGGVSFNF